jgi:tetratricopeptide (TPR) repeat protein
LIALQQPIEGIELLKRSIQLGNNSHSIWNNLGTAYYNSKQYKEALEYETSFHSYQSYHRLHLHNKRVVSYSDLLLSF